MRKKPVQRERFEQAHIVALLRSLRAEVFVLGTTRRAGDHHGTMQTPGLPDLIAFLPPINTEPTVGPIATRLACWVQLVVEVKAKGGRLRPEQQHFRDCCINANVWHVVGDLDAVIGWLIEQHYLKGEQVAHYRRPQPAGLEAK